MLKIPQIRTALSESWSEKTCSIYCSRNKPNGQCSVTAIVVQNVYGGEILKTEVQGKWHYYNRIDGEVYDFTASQFKTEPHYSDILSSEEEALTDCTNMQVEALMESFKKAIKDC